MYRPGGEGFNKGEDMTIDRFIYTAGSAVGVLGILVWGGREWQRVSRSCKSSTLVVFVKDVGSFEVKVTDRR